MRPIFSGTNRERPNVSSVRGVIFDIQHYSIHDGPGIRTTVFLKGCPLRCQWCHNPESQSARPEIFVDVDRCLDCEGACVSACPAGAIRVSNGRPRTNRGLCRIRYWCGQTCVDACSRRARQVVGRYVTAAEVLEELRADVPFYRASGGGVTLSGGEPLGQPRFARALLELAKEEGLHTALDTCGYACWETMRMVLERVDVVLYDIKHVDERVHRRVTGVGCRRIMENARRIAWETGVEMWVRIPVIPGVNDDPAVIRGIGDFVARLGSGRVTRVELLPFHRWAGAKYARLEREWDWAYVEEPSAGRIELLAEELRLKGLPVVAGR